MGCIGSGFVENLQPAAARLPIIGEAELVVVWNVNNDAIIADEKRILEFRYSESIDLN